VSTEDHNVNSALCGENAAPYVLGVLSEQEHGAFVEHLASCAVCREEVAALQVVVGALPAVAPQLSAPPELKQRVMASVRADIAQSSEDRSLAREGGRSWLPRVPVWQWRPLVASGALVAVVVVLAVIAFSSGSGGSGGIRVIRAQVAPSRADVSLRVVGGHAQLDISGLPQTPPQRVYEVWVKRSGAPQPTDALFTVTAKGDATVGVPGSLNGVKVVMVTAEPLGGSKVPTSSPVIVARLS
jgi:anti-sigma-K factor RskA